MFSKHQQMKGRSPLPGGVTTTVPPRSLPGLPAATRDQGLDDSSHGESPEGANPETESGYVRGKRGRGSQLKSAEVSEFPSWRSGNKTD